MATESDYPTALDTLQLEVVNNLRASDGDAEAGNTDTAEGFHALLHNLANSAILALETELGLEPSGASASVAARLTAIDTAIALKQNSAGAATDAEVATIRSELETLIAAKAAPLGFTPENAANKDAGALASSDAKFPTSKAAKTYTDAEKSRAEAAETTLSAAVAGLTSADSVVYKGVIDCSGNPNYPAADAGHLYRVSVAGKIGGASGTKVEPGDTLLCNTDGTSAGTQAAVGSKWNVIQVNIDGAVIGPTSAVDANLPLFDGTTGKLIKDSGVSTEDFDEAGAGVAAVETLEDQLDPLGHKAYTDSAVDAAVTGTGTFKVVTIESKEDLDRPRPPVDKVLWLLVGFTDEPDNSIDLDFEATVGA